MSLGLRTRFGPRHLGDVDQAFNAGLEFDEEAEVGQAGYGAADALAGFVLVGNRVPGMRLQLLHAERNALLVGSTFRTLTSISCPAESTSEGLLTRLQEISETCSRPSMPPMSTKAP